MFCTLKLTLFAVLVCLHMCVQRAGTAPLDVDAPGVFEHPGASGASEDLMNEPVRAHFARVTLRKALEYLVPGGWSIEFDVPDGLPSRHVVFHAETTRRRALDDLLSGLGLKGVLYPRAGVLLIHRPR